MAQKDVLDVLSKVRSDPKLTKDFIEHPEQTLKKLGVDATGLTVQKLPGRKVTAEAPAAAAVCGSVGCIGCVSVG